MKKKTQEDYKGFYMIEKHPLRLAKHNAVSWDKIESVINSKADRKAHFGELAIAVKNHKHGTKGVHGPVPFVKYCIKNNWLKKVAPYKVKFKLAYTIRSLDIHSNKPLELPIEGPDNVKIVIRTPNKEERAIGRKTFNAFCGVVGEFEPTKKALPVFTAMLAGKRPPENQKAKTADDMVIRKGPSYGLEYYPNPFISFIDKVNKKLSNPVRTTISFLRWRNAQEGPPSPISSGELLWSNDNGDNWLPLPANYSAKITSPSSSILKTEKISINELKKAVALGLEEPVYHELLREAKELKFKSSRSSILVAISAAEVAVKEVLYKLVPKGQWLIENITFPPIFKVVKEYFPKIVPEEKYIRIKETCESLIPELHKAISLRNLIAHQGQSPPDDEKVEDIIQLVEQLLWICDYCSGYEWSADYIDL